MKSMTANLVKGERSQSSGVKHYSRRARDNDSLSEEGDFSEHHHNGSCESCQRGCQYRRPHVCQGKVRPVERFAERDVVDMRAECFI